MYKAYTSRWWSDANGGRGINGRPRKQERSSRKERTKKGRDPGKGRRLGGRSLIQVGNPATPSNETDRLSYLHRLASINSRGWYTNTKESPRARVYIHHVGRARGDAVTTSGQPTHQPPIYLRPKRNSRIYFTYALLPPYFQLYRQRREASKRRDRGERERGAEREGGRVHAHAFWPHKERIRDFEPRDRFSPRFRASSPNR